jgi:hypothetical protein
MAFEENILARNFDVKRLLFFFSLRFNVSVIAVGLH